MADSTPRELPIPDDVAEFLRNNVVRVSAPAEAVLLMAMLEELRAIRADLQALRAERQAPPPAATKPAPTYPTMAGPAPAKE